MKRKSITIILESWRFSLMDIQNFSEAAFMVRMFSIVLLDYKITGLANQIFVGKTEKLTEGGRDGTAYSNTPSAFCRGVKR